MAEVDDVGKGTPRGTAGGAGEEIPTLPSHDAGAAKEHDSHRSTGEEDHGHGHHEPTTPLGKWIHFLQKYSLPLLSGIFVGLIWANADPDSYERAVGASYDAWVIGDWHIFDHPVTIHFCINDIFMCFFFGIAAKEVTESCLPGGSLNPPKKAFSPLFATLGGVSIPIACYFIFCILFWGMGAFDGYELEASGSSSSDGHRMLSEVAGNGTSYNPAAGTASSSGSSAAATPIALSDVLVGWGVPTATDISLAWMIAVQVFPFHHPAIDFLLLLAVADDACGLVIIAAAYGDPAHPFQPVYLLFVVGGALIAFLLRIVFRMQHWSPYVVLGGVCSWIGLIGAALHPALALCFVVPFMPSRPPASKPKQLPTLHAFEHDLKLFVDMGMFFFTLANAGVRLGAFGALTWAVLLSLIVGKIVGVTAFVLTADMASVAPLNPSIKKLDITMVGSMGAIGLTVALFVSGEAFQDPTLQGEAKLGALLSGLMGVACMAAAKMPCWKRAHESYDDHASQAEDTVTKKAAERPKIEGLQDLNVGTAAYYKHQIRAGEGAFDMPFHKADKAGIFDMDHERAQRHWGILRTNTRKVLPVGGLGEESTMRKLDEGTVIGLFKKAPLSRAPSTVEAATLDASAPAPEAAAESTTAAGAEDMVQEIAAP